MKRRSIIQAAFIVSVLGLYGCEDPVTIYVCDPGQSHCVSKSMLGECTIDGQLIKTECESGTACYEKNKTYGCFPYDCDPVQYKPVCDSESNSIIYCIDNIYKPSPCGDLFQCVNPEDERGKELGLLGAACIAQNEIMDVCNQGESRCSPENQTRQICNNGEWMDVGCPTGQQCNKGTCEDIPECNEGNKKCETDETTGLETHYVCRDKKWISTPCNAEQTCSRTIGCVNSSGIPNEGEACTEGAESFCVDGYYYACVNGHYTVVLCNESNGKICLDREAGDMCVTDIEQMGCSNEDGQSIPCCQNINSTIFNLNCSAGLFTYWKCIDVDGVLYAMEYQAESHCRGTNRRAYCIDGISLLQEEQCPMGCIDDNMTSATCNGNNVGDQCTVDAYQARCLNSNTARYCDAETGTIAEQTCVEGEICRQTECTPYTVPSEGDTCVPGAIGYCVDSDFLECIDGQYVRTDCSAATGKACLTFTDGTGDKCVYDASNMQCTDRETGESVECCQESNDRILNQSCSNGHFSYWQCLVVNGKGYASFHEVESMCNQNGQSSSMFYCPEGASFVEEISCPGGCSFLTDTSVSCKGNDAGDACQQATYPSKCLDTKTERICSAEGVIVENTCAAGEMCINDKCEPSSLPEVGSPCPEGASSLCFNDNTIMECVNGTYQTSSCSIQGYTNLCKVHEGQALCVSDHISEDCSQHATPSNMFNYSVCFNGKFNYWTCLSIDGTYYGKPDNTAGICIDTKTILTCQSQGQPPSKVPCEGSMTCQGVFNGACQ